MWWVLAAVSHFSMIGFAVDSRNPETFADDLIKYAETCEPLLLQADHRICVISDRSGAEIWVGLDAKAGQFEAQTFNPALRGKGRTQVIVDGDVSAAQWKPFEITIQAEFAEAKTPLIFELADPREASAFLPKAKLEVDLTGFADEVEIFESETAYYASQQTKEVKFASNHFIPSGMFKESEADKTPTPHALFAGTILDSELRQNERGKAQYWWVLVRTYDGAVVNVVADPAMVKSRPPKGGILSGSFWLSGRLVRR
jgi:hypothetical protein